MRIIRENPYRAIGVYCGSSTREIQKQLAKVKAFSRVGKQTKLETDFEFLGEINRNNELIETAAIKIEQAKNKVLYSLFWFYKSNHIDEAALNYLAKNDTDKSIEIWSKLVDTSNEKVTQKNFSSYLNLSTLFIELGYQNKEPELFLTGINFKGKALSSDVFSDFVQKIAGENILLNQEVISNEVLLEIIKVTDKGDVKVNYSDLMEAFSTFPENVKSQLRKKYTEKPIQKIEQEIEFAKQKRIENPLNADKFGENLYTNTKNPLMFLKKTMGNNSIEIQTLSNSLANEVLQCSIDYFNKHRELEDIDPGEEALKIAKWAKSVCMPGATLNRIEENLQVIEEWVNDKEEREQYAKCSKSLEFIGFKLREVEDYDPSLDLAEDLIEDCTSELQIIKKELGKENDIYIDYSSAVGSTALGIIVFILNKLQEDLIHDPLKRIDFPYQLSKAYDILNLIKKLDMNSEAKSRYSKNYQVIVDMLRKVNPSKLHKSTASKKTSQPKKNTPKVNKETVSRNYSRSSNSGATTVYIVFAIIVLIIFFSTFIDNDDSSKTNTYSTENYTSNDDNSEKSSDYEPVIKESEYKGNKLTNGSSPYNSYFGKGIYNQNHQNWITFKNGYNTDAIVCLVNYYTGKTIRNEYIQAGTGFQMTNIPNGVYYMKVFSGKDWNPIKRINNGKIIGGFDTDISFYESKNISDLLKLNDDGYRYSTGEITLYQVSNGNMQTQNISEDTFFK